MILSILCTFTAALALLPWLDAMECVGLICWPIVTLSFFWPVSATVALLLPI